MSNIELIKEIFKRLSGNALFVETDRDIDADALDRTLTNLKLNDVYRHEYWVDYGMHLHKFIVKG